MDNWTKVAVIVGIVAAFLTLLQVAIGLAQWLGWKPSGVLAMLPSARAVLVVLTWIALGVTWFALWRVIHRTEPVVPPVPVASTTPQSVGMIPTELRLQFGDINDLPTKITNDNIWRWYALKTINIGMNPKTKKLEQVIGLWTIFVTFDKPVNFSQIRVTSTGALPTYEVKDSSQRSAVITIQGAIEHSVLDIQCVPL